MTNKSSELIEVAEIVYEKPLAGAFEEVLFGSDYGNTLWVRFSDRDGITEWIGKFGCGFSTSMRVTKVVAPDQFMIVAGGFAYLVDATKRRLLNQHLKAYAQDIAYDPMKNHFIAGDTSLHVIENGKEIWASKRISIDGISSMSIEGRILSGLSVVGYTGETSRFEFDLDSRVFVSGPGSSIWFMPVKQSTKKHWWKFWR